MKSVYLTSHLSDMLGLELQPPWDRLALAHGLLEAGGPRVTDLSVDDNEIGLAGGQDPLAVSCHINPDDWIYDNREIRGHCC